jgi:hypothetical protein
MSVMVCTPLLLDSLIMLLMFLREASQLLIRYKTLQLKEHVRSKKSKDKGGTTNGTAGGAPTAKSDSKKEK